MSHCLWLWNVATCHGMPSLKPRPSSAPDLRPSQRAFHVRSSRSEVMRAWVRGQAYRGKLPSSTIIMPSSQSSCHSMPFHAILCHSMPFSCHSMPFYAILCYSHAIPCHSMPFYAILMPFHANLSLPFSQSSFPVRAGTFYLTNKKVIAKLRLLFDLSDRRCLL